MEGAGCLFLGVFETHSLMSVSSFHEEQFCYHLKASFWPQSALTMVSWKPQVTLLPLFSLCLQKTLCAVAALVH